MAYIITKGGTNFRKAPNTSGAVIKVLPANTVLKVVEKVSGKTWYKADLNGTVGYVTSLDKHVSPYTLPTSDRLQKAKSLVEYGEQFLDVQYVYGSKRFEATSFDCSDFIQYIFFKHLGIKLDADSRSQSDDAPAVGLDSLEIGDVVFFQKNGSIYHVALYAGNNKILHTYNNTADILNENLAKTGGKGGVTYSSFAPGGYWRSKAGYCKAIRPIK